VDVVEHGGPDGPASATPAWLRVLDGSPPAGPFAHPAWASTWCSVYGRFHPPLVLELRDGGRPVAILPLQQTTYPGLRTKRLEFIGGSAMTRREWLLNPRHPGQAIYSDLVVTPGFEQQALDALRSWLTDRAGVWDELRLTCVPATGAFARGFPALAERWSPRVVVSEKVYIDTRPGWPAYRGRLGKRQQRHLRYEPNTLARKAGADLELVVHRGEDVPERVDELSDLFARRWAARDRGMPAGNRVLYRRLACARELHPAVYSLVAGGRPVAMQFGFDDGRRYLPYVFAFDPFLDHTSPANVLIAFAIRRCCEDGHAEVDLAALDAVDRWAGDPRPRADLVATSPRALGRARAAGLDLTARSIAALHESRAGRRVVRGLGRARLKAAGR